jgi:hypothetical protein
MEIPSTRNEEDVAPGESAAVRTFVIFKRF